MYLKRLGWLLLSALLLIAAVPALADDEVTVTSRGFTNIRSGPGTTYSIVNVLLEGEQATATGRDSTSNSWLRIEYDGSQGWVAASVVRVSGDPTTLDIVESSGAEKTVGNTGITATAQGEVNIRLGPGSSYRVIRQTEEGETFDVTGISGLDYPLVCQRGRIFDTSGADDVENVWLQINFNGFSGWVSYSVVSVSGDLCDVDEAEADEVPTVVQDFLNEVVIVTLDNVNLRASNYASSEVLAVVPYNTRLVAEARDENSSRVRVTYRGETGWISLSLAETVRGSIDNLPVEEE